MALLEGAVIHILYPQINRVECLSTHTGTPHTGTCSHKRDDQEKGAMLKFFNRTEPEYIFFLNLGHLKL